jgi:hypothetical protein
VARVLQDWLAKSPRGRLELGSEEAREAVEVMTGAADSGILGALVLGDAAGRQGGGPGSS